MDADASSFFGGANALTLHAAFDLASPEEPAALPGKDEEDVAPSPLAAEKKPKWKPTGSSVGRIFRSDGSSAKTVTVTKEEWDEVKESQRRMEDMLQKVLTITAAAK